MSTLTGPQRKVLQFLDKAGRASTIAIGTHLHPTKTVRQRASYADLVVHSLKGRGLIQVSTDGWPAWVLTDEGREVVAR